jgi:hypothetical protein
VRIFIEICKGVLEAMLHTAFLRNNCIYDKGEMGNYQSQKGHEYMRNTQVVAHCKCLYMVRSDYKSDRAGIVEKNQF